MNGSANPVVAIDPVVPPARIRDLRTEALADLIRERSARPIRRLLVVGCGSGKEAAVLAEALQAHTVGIDLVEQFDPTAAAVVDLRRGDATDLEFPDHSFDFVYCYHTLEHIPITWQHCAKCAACWLTAAASASAFPIACV